MTRRTRLFASIATLVAVATIVGPPAWRSASDAPASNATVSPSTGGGHEPPVGAGPASDRAAGEPANPWLSGEGLARAAAFRNGAGLRADPDWLRFVATNPEALRNVARYSVPVLDSEVARITDRETILANLEQFRTRHLAAWGGYFLDGNVFVIWLIDPTGAVEAELRTAIPPPFVVKPARWSLEQLQRVADQIDRDPWLRGRYQILSLGADTEHNAVALQVRSTDPSDMARITTHFGLGEELIVTIDDSPEAQPLGRLSAPVPAAPHAPLRQPTLEPPASRPLAHPARRMTADGAESGIWSVRTRSPVVD